MTDNVSCWWMLSGHLFQNVMLLMMGSAEELPQAPLERPKFIEDMSDAEAAAAVSGVCVRGEEENLGEDVEGGPGRRWCNSRKFDSNLPHTHTIIVTVVFADWSGELWQHVLHERHFAVFQGCP